jgi:hypothetical protein
VEPEALLQDAHSRIWNLRNSLAFIQHSQTSSMAVAYQCLKAECAFPTVCLSNLENRQESWWLMLKL